MTVKHARAAAVVAALSLAAAPASAAVTPSEAIKARHGAMEKAGDAMKALGAMARKQAPFDAAAVKKNAGIIAENLRTAAKLFPKGSDKGDVETWAKPEIWAEGSTFTKTFEAAQAAAVALQSVADEAAFRPALGELGNQCKACHDPYRRPSE
jgi:cytochrome c556